MTARQTRKKHRLVVASSLGLSTLCFAFAFVPLLGFDDTALVNQALAAVSAKVGAPVTATHTRLGLTGIELDGVKVGNLLAVDRVNADLNLNPLQGPLGKIDALHLDHVRINKTLATTKPSWAALPTQPADAMTSLSLTVQHAVQRVLSSDHVPSSIHAVALSLALDNGHTLELQGLHVYRSQHRIAATVRQASLDQRVIDKDLYASLTEPPGATPTFMLERRIRARGLGHRPEVAWKLTGPIPQAAKISLQLEAQTLPAIVQPLLSPYMVTNALGLGGKIDLERSPDGAWLYTVDATTTGLRLHHASLGDTAIGPIGLHLVAQGSWQSGELLIDRSELSTLHAPQGLTLAATGQLERTPNSWRVRASARMPTTPCQLFMTEAPPGLLTTLTGFNLSGTTSLDASVSFSLPLEPHEGGEGDLQIHDHGSHFDCDVLQAPRAFTKDALLGPIVAEQVRADGSPQPISLTTTNPDFTPYALLGHNVTTAFVDAEDAGFWHHHGVVLGALIEAARRNLGEGRIAAGGSTITMQTAKNVFLWRQRTITRKLQELFLAWYIEREVPKQRILELYLNVVEFGPNLFGIRPAAQAFFHKEPAELSYLEATYLASLLPSPKTRYRNYCMGSISPGYRRYLDELLNRAVSLGLVDEATYRNAMSETLHFSQADHDAIAACQNLAKAR